MNRRDIQSLRTETNKQTDMGYQHLKTVSSFEAIPNQGEIKCTLLTPRQTPTQQGPYLMTPTPKWETRPIKPCMIVPIPILSYPS